MNFYAGDASYLRARNFGRYWTVSPLVNSQPEDEASLTSDGQGALSCCQGPRVHHFGRVTGHPEVTPKPVNARVGDQPPETRIATSNASMSELANIGFQRWSPPVPPGYFRRPRLGCRFNELTKDAQGQFVSDTPGEVIAYPC